MEVKNIGETPRWRIFIASILACAVISLSGGVLYIQKIGMSWESFLRTARQSVAQVVESKEPNELLGDKDSDIEVIHEVLFEKTKKFWPKRASSSPTPALTDRPVKEPSRAFKHEELCDEKLTWDKLPDDDSWSKRWTWPRFKTPRIPREKELMLMLYRHQLCRGDPSKPDPCNRTLEFDSHRTGSGIGSRMVTLTKALTNSMYSNRVLRINLGDWRYSSKDKCPEMSNICFFQEVSRCRNVSWPYAEHFDIFGQSHEEPGDPTPHVRMWFPAGVSHKSPMNYTSPSPRHLGNFWYSGKMLYFLIQPKDWLLRRVNDVKLELGIKKPYVAMHVRHGDKASEGTEFFDLSIYMNIVMKHFPLIKNILVMTSDQMVIDDTKYYPDYNFYWTDYPRHNADIKKLMEEGLLDGFDEMVNALINFYLAVQSAGMVCTLTSNFPRAIIRFQYGAYNHVNPVYSLDEWRKDVAVHTFPEAELGEVVHMIDPEDYRKN